MERITWIVLALLMLEYIVLGGWLGRAWGINPSRSTPYAGRTGKRCGGGWILLCVHLLAGLWPALLACAPLYRDAQHTLACLPLAVCALLGGLLSMLTLFVSIRHEGKRIPDVAGALHGVWLGKSMHALAALSMIAYAGSMLAMLPALLRGELRGQEIPEQLSAYALLMLCGLYALLPDAVLSPRMRSEKYIRRIGLGGVLLSCMLPLLLAQPEARAAVAQELGRIGLYIQAALCVASALIAAYLACVSAKGLFSRRMILIRRKKKAEILAPIAAVLLIALSACAPVGYLMLFSGAVGFGYAMLALSVCVLWLGSVGRGLFFRRK